MTTLTPKQFIQNVFIEAIGDIHMDHPYISFAIMAIGIEFLGKCLNERDGWNESGHSKPDFELAITTLDSFTRYRPLLSSYNLWDSLRNGFSHSFVPKSSIRLSSKDEAAHLTISKPGQINLKCEDFYEDFKNACKEVIDRTFINEKMNKPLLEVPTPPSNTSSQQNSQSSIPINDIKTSGSTY